jgi:hypothetical protein
MLSKFPRKLLAVLILVGFGVARLPVEQGLETKLTEKHFRDSELDLSMREKVGQAGFVAAFGGFRSLVASMLYLQAHVEFENYEWAKVENSFAVITGLQPRSFHYWDSAHWHMAYNAYGYYMRRSEFEKDKTKAWFMVNKDAPYYRERGKQFLEEGLKYLPEEPKMYRLMGELYRLKYEDNCAAADWYFAGVHMPNARTYMMRGYLYSISQCEGREEEAYEALRKSYEEGNDTPTVVLGYERKEDLFIDRAIAGQSEQQLIDAAAASGDDYMPKARLARFYGSKQVDLQKAAGIYGFIAKQKAAPAFYQKKFGLTLSLIPGNETQAVLVLKKFLEGRRRGIYDDVEDAIRRMGSEP